MFFRRNWIKTTGRVLDSSIRKTYDTRVDGQVVGPPSHLHNYVVEFTAPNGEPTRLEVEQHSETIDVPIGTEVPLLVHPTGKRAVLDKKHPTINMMALSKARREASREADKDRFRDLLDG